MLAEALKQTQYHHGDINSVRYDRFSVVVIVLVKLECMMASLACGAQTKTCLEILFSLLVLYIYMCLHTQH